MKKCIRLAVCVGVLATWGLDSHAVHAQTNAIATGNWSSPGTWSGGVPSDALSAIINGGHTVTVDQAGAITNLLDLGTIAGETGTLNVTTGGQLGFFDFDPAPGDPTAMRVGSAAGGTGVLTMNGGEIFIQEDILDAFDSGDLTVGQFGTGTATISGGTVTAGDEIFLGRDAGGDGTISLSGSSQLTAQRRNILVGFGGANAEEGLVGGKGKLNVSGSSQVSVSDTLFMGFGDGNAEAGLAGASGELSLSDTATVTITNWMQTGFGLGTTSVINQSGGTLSVGGLLVHAARGTATYNHTGGDVTADIIIIGDGVGETPAHGTYNISGGATVKTDFIFWVGAWGKSQGFVNQNGGTANLGALTVGRDGYGEYKMSAGNLTVEGTDGAVDNNHLIVGKVGNADENIAKGSGIFEQTGGTVTVKTGVFLGDYDHTEGTYKISGGTLNVTGTGSHPAANAGDFESFIGDFSVGGALASNALIARTEPTNADDAQGQASNANGTFIVSGSAATINIAGNFLANPADKSDFRSDPLNPGASNSATLGFEIFNNSGTSLINVGGVADLDGAVVDLDLMSGFTPALNSTFDLLRASSFGATGTGTTQNVGDGKGFSLASEDAGGWNLAVVPDGAFSILRATFLGLTSSPGDFDNDGDVDGRDFLLWQRNPSVGSLSDWQANYGDGSLAAVGAVPEPASVALLTVFGACAIVARGRKTTR